MAWKPRAEVGVACAEAAVGAAISKIQARSAPAAAAPMVAAPGRLQPNTAGKATDGSGSDVAHRERDSKPDIGGTLLLPPTSAGGVKLGTAQNRKIIPTGW